MKFGEHWLAGQVGRRGAGVEVDLVLLPRDRTATPSATEEVGTSSEHVDAVAVEPLARDRDRRGRACSGGRPRSTSTFMPLAGDAEFLQRLLGADDRGGAAGVGVGAGLVVQHADLDGGRTPAPARGRDQRQRQAAAAAAGSAGRVRRVIRSC